MKSLPTYEELKKPLKWYSPKKYYYLITKFFINTLGNLSNGIRIGNTYGHDSGVMLDYVYKNKPSGKLLIGKIIDYFYINSTGWKGIRLRKILIKEYIKKAIETQLEKKKKINLLDIACGGGEYDIEILNQFPQNKISAELRDYKKENIEKAEQNARAAGLNNIKFKQADAFNSKNYKKKYDIIISSGFWEIIENDDLIQKCIKNISSSLNKSGSLVFTIQPYHPQLELIARTLKSNTGKPWIMKLRSLDLMKSWIKKENLIYLSHKMDKYGIFGVVMAKKQ